MDGRATFRAYAKVNLCLSVGAPIAEGPQAGYHPIASWMQAIDLFDEVSIDRGQHIGPESKYTIRWADDAPRATPIDWPLEKDLAVRAHRAFESHARASSNSVAPVHIEVVKRIPVGSGLGGGSSDAARVLMGLLKQYPGGITDEDLLKLAMSLGSDVGFFADASSATGEVPQAALVNGLGDKIRRVESVPGALLLVIPPYPCPTGPVYKAFDEILKERQAQEAADRAARGITGREKQTGPKESLVESRWSRASKDGQIDGDHLFSDLALAAYRVEPRLGKLVTALSNATRQQAHVTGSGSCVFIPTMPDRAPRLLERVEKLLASSEEFAGTKVLRTRLL
jgi:4-diphosphocytidyl-2C-methyl-D-erythritol kinase